MTAHRLSEDWGIMVEEGVHEIADPGSAGTIRMERHGVAFCDIVTAAAEARTLADPDGSFQLLLLRLKTDGGDATVTADSAVDQAGNTALTFDDANDSIVLISISDGAGTYAWRVLANDGVGGVASEEGGFDLNGAADAGVLDADGDTTISAPTDDQIDFEVGGSDGMSLNGTGLTLAAGSQNFRTPSVLSATIDYTDSSTALFTVPASEVWVVHDVLVNVTTNFDATANDATYQIGDGDDANGFVDLVDAELQAADTEITGGQAGWQGQLSGTKGAYLADGSFVVVGAETIDGTCGGTTPTAGAGTAWLFYTRIT